MIHEHQCKILNNILANRMEDHIEYIMYHDQEGFISRCKLFQLILYMILTDLGRRKKLIIISRNTEKSFLNFKTNF